MVGSAEMGKVFPYERPSGGTFSPSTAPVRLPVGAGRVRSREHRSGQPVLAPYQQLLPYSLCQYSPDTPDADTPLSGNLAKAQALGKTVLGYTHIPQAPEIRGFSRPLGVPLALGRVQFSGALPSHEGDSLQDGCAKFSLK